MRFDFRNTFATLLQIDPFVLIPQMAVLMRKVDIILNASANEYAMFVIDFVGSAKSVHSELTWFMAQVRLHSLYSYVSSESNEEVRSGACAFLCVDCI